MSKKKHARYGRQQNLLTNIDRPPEQWCSGSKVSTRVTGSEVYASALVVKYLLVSLLVKNTFLKYLLVISVVKYLLVSLVV